LNWLSNPLDTVLSTAGDIWTDLSLIASWAKSGVTNALDWLTSALDGASEIADDIWDALDNIAGETFKTFVNIIATLGGNIPGLGLAGDIVEGTVGRIPGVGDGPTVVQPPSQEQNIQFASGNDGQTIIEIDGREVGRVIGISQRGFTAARNIDG
jgi:hypothetical protein